MMFLDLYSISGKLMVLHRKNTENGNIGQGSQKWYGKQNSAECAWLEGDSEKSVEVCPFLH